MPCGLQALSNMTLVEAQIAHSNVMFVISISPVIHSLFYLISQNTTDPTTLSPRPRLVIFETKNTFDLSIHITYYLTFLIRAIYWNWERKQDTFREDDEHFVEIERYSFLSEFCRGGWRWRLFLATWVAFVVKYGVQRHDHDDPAASFCNCTTQELKSRG